MSRLQLNPFHHRIFDALPVGETVTLGDLRTCAGLTLPELVINLEQLIREGYVTPEQERVARVSTLPEWASCPHIRTLAVVDRSRLTELVK